MRRDELLAEVVLNLESRRGALAFTATLEDHYREAIAAMRRRAMVIASAIGLVVLGAFTVQRLVFAEASVAWTATMAAIAATSFGTLVIARFSRSHRVLDRATMAALMAIALLVCVSFRIDSGGAATAGLYCYAMVPLAAGSLAALHFLQAASVNAVAIVVYAVALFGKPDLDPTLDLPALLMVVSVAAMTLWGNFRADRDHRTLFLYLTRERLLSELSLEQNEVLRRMSDRDALTGIANRRAFDDAFRLIETTRERNLPTVIMIDIDHFKRFNDHYGHFEGDRCLKRVVEAIAAELRDPEDFFARLGGEEFVVLAGGLDEVAAAGLLERLRAGVEALGLAHEGIRGRRDDVVTVSLGCALPRRDGIESRRELLGRADTALYAAKNLGRNRWRIG